MQKKFEQIEHTGDIGLKIYGKSLEELFQNAASGMFSIIGDLSKVRPKIKRKIEVDADDLQQLLVNWLSELNFYFSTQDEIFSQFKITKLEGNRLRAIVQGEKYNHQKHELYTEVKAVTYHQLYIKEKDGEWEAQVIFDL